MVFTLIGALPILILLFVIIGVSKAKNNHSDKEGEDMIKQLYVYLVMFTMLLLSVGGGIGLFMGVADMVNPTSNIQSFSDYKNSQASYDESGKQIKSRQTEDQLYKAYQDEVKFEREQAINQAKGTIIDSMGFIVIPLPIFLFFNRIRKTRENE